MFCFVFDQEAVQTAGDRGMDVLARARAVAAAAGQINAAQNSYGNCQLKY